MHLLIPYANSRTPECQAALQSLKLPNLDKLLRQLTLAHTDEANEATLSPPHERALAADFGITAADGQIPFGAYHAAQAGETVLPGPGVAGQGATPNQAWAVITPCHWTVQTSHITMTLPSALNLGVDESQALLAAMQPYFAEDGIALIYDTPNRWLARGEIFAGLATASPYRVVGGHVDDWLPKAASAKLLRRLQNEMQMLLYTHPLTDARAAQGLPAVNSFWVSGTGALPVGFAHSPQSIASTSQAVTVPNTLRDAAVLGDWAAWAQAWQTIDSTECAALLQALEQKNEVNAAANHSIKLTLCGDRSAQTYALSQKGLASRLLHSFKSKFRHLPTSYIISLL